MRSIGHSMTVSPGGSISSISKIPVCPVHDTRKNRNLSCLRHHSRCERVASKGTQFSDDLRTLWMKKCVPLTSKSAYPRRGTQNFINVRVLKVRLFWAADQTLPIPDIRKTLQVLSCKVYGGDSWTRTNDPIDVNDVLSLCG